MTTFVDTSALYAQLASEDRDQDRAVATLRRLRGADERLVTHSYVVSETSALVQRRIGQRAVIDFHLSFEPLMDVVWIDPDIHRAAVNALTGAERAAISLTDRVSFEVMRRLGLSRVFAFDKHFAEQGFETIP